MSILDTLSINNQDQQRIYGVATGIVTNNQDEESLGRVKLKFPWLADDHETNWVRVASFMTGTETGVFFLPEVGDEVLVAFQQGSIDHPYVIGSLWNGTAAPPETNSGGKNNLRKIRSRSGHELIFDDSAEEQTAKLEIQTNAGHTILLDDAASAEKIEIRSKAGHKITMNDAPGQEMIEIVDKSGSNKITIDSLQNAIAMESGMMLTIKANMVEIEGTTSLTLKSSAMVTIQGMPIKLN